MGNNHSSSISNARPSIFVVPSNDSELLDFSRISSSPEKVLKDKLLSSDPSAKALAAVGSSGTGKTTILRALATRPDVCAHFKDGIWYIELGRDATLDALTSQLKLLAKDACDQAFGASFAEQIQNSSTRILAVMELVRRLSNMNFLLILDDVWDSNNATYPLVKRFSTEIQQANGSLKLLTSTQVRAVAQSPIHSDFVDVIPRAWDDKICVAILCHYAGIDRNAKESISSESRSSFTHVLRTCGGLPLALAVAGSCIRSLIDAIGNESEKHIAWSKYWESLRRNIAKLGNTASMHHGPLFDTIYSSLSVLERTQGNKTGLTCPVVLAFESLCMMRKNGWIPEHVLERTWSAAKDEIDSLVNLLANASIISRTVQHGTWGVRCHDLVLDYSAHLSMRNGRGPKYWHSRLVCSVAKGIGAEIYATREGLRMPCFWDIACREDMYLEENIVRHMVCGGDIPRAVHLCLDYRWIARLNSDYKKHALQQSMTDCVTVMSALKESGTAPGDQNQSYTQELQLLAAQMEKIVDAMEMAIYQCTRNRRECPFQLQGRLVHTVPKNDLISFCIRSIERHAGTYGPWVRAGPSVLFGPHVSFKRVFPIPFGASMFTLGLNSDELIVGGVVGEQTEGRRQTELVVMDRKTGSITSSHREVLSQGHSRRLIGIAADQVSNEIIVCTQDHCVRVLSDKMMTLIDTPFQDDNGAEISSMAFAPKTRTLLCGSVTGYVCLFSLQCRRTVSLWKAHDEKIVGLAVSDDCKVVLSASADGSLRRWDINDVYACDRSACESPVAVDLLPSVDRERLLYFRKGQNTRCIAVSGSGNRVACKQGWVAPNEKWGGLLVWERGVELPYTVDDEVVLDIAFDRDDNYAFCALGSRGIGVLKFGTGAPTWIKHIDARFCYKSLLVSEDRSELITLIDTAGHEDQIRILRRDRVGGESDERLPPGTRACLSNVHCFAVSQDGRTAVSSSNSHGLRLYEVRRNDMIEAYEFCPHREPCTSDKVFRGHGTRLAVTNDRELVAHFEQSPSDSSDYLSIYKCSGMHRLALISHDALLSAVCGLLAIAERSSSVILRVSSLHFSSDGKALTALIITSSRENQDIWTAATWNSRSGHLRSSLQLHNRGHVFGIQHAWHQLQSLASRPFLCIEEPLHGWYTTSVLLCQGDTCKKIATLDIEPVLAVYCPSARLLWYLQWDGGIDYHLKYLEFVSEPLRSPLIRSTVSHSDEQGPYYIKNSSDLLPYSVFISHAGPDKHTIAIPLYQVLEGNGIRCFVDRIELEPGDIAAEKMEAAMEKCELAIFVLSPEFAARRWTMRELRHFLKRVFGNTMSHTKPPVVIPVFYRLSIGECRSLDPCDQTKHRLADGSSLFLKEGFFNPDRQQEATTDTVKESMKAITEITGIENEECASNSLCDPLALQARGRLIERIVASVIRRHTSLKQTS